MAQAVRPGMAPLRVRLASVVSLTDEDFFQLCQDNRDMRLERSADGEVMIMPPTGAETGRRNMRLAGQLDAWTQENGVGIAFDSSTGFALSNGAIRSPDASWVSRPRWEALTEDERLGFAPLAPDFVLELRSPSDRLDDLKAKMEEYRDNGVRLGWLIDPVERRVHVYEPERTHELDAPSELRGEPVLPGFTLQLAPIWSH